MRHYSILRTEKLRSNVKFVLGCVVSVFLGAWIDCTIKLYNCLFGDATLLSAGQNAQGVENVVKPIAILCALIVVALSLWVLLLLFKNRNEHLKERTLIYRSTRFDYKYYAALGAGNVVDAGLVNLFKTSYCETNQIRVIRLTENSAIRSAADFFKSDLGSHFRCLPVREDQKRNMCIIQMLYVPEDEEGNIPLIIRMPEYHPTETVREPETPMLSFISFSPVPQQYGQEFSIEECYYREVPRSDCRTVSFRERYVIMRRDTYNRLYVFFVVSVKYNDARFLKSDPDGTRCPNRETLARLFGSPLYKKPDDPRYFLKDHDEIIYAATPKEINNHFCQRNPQADLSRVFSGCLDVRGVLFDMSEARMMGVEAEVVHNLATDVGA